MLAVAVSGGVDSLFALYEQVRTHSPDQVLALHGRFLGAPEERDPLPGLRANCERLGVRLHVVDAEAAFEQAVMVPFAESYRQGQTPNPCALCNVRIKFGLLLDAAREYGATALATGHYARMVQHPIYGAALASAHDRAKDQSYFLALVPADRLPLLHFPLHDRLKADIRRELESAGLHVPLPVESQEICFIPDNDYRAFLTARGQQALPGPIKHVGTGQVVGQHEGLWRHTEGQRRGLRIAWSEPLYVVGKSSADNVLWVGPKETLLVQTCSVQGVNLLVPQRLWPEQVLARVRYRQEALPARVVVREAETGTRMDIHFDQPRERAAPGQLAVVYDTEGYVLAGGLVAPSVGFSCA